MLREQEAKKAASLMCQTGSWSLQANIASLGGGAAVVQSDVHGWLVTELTKL